MVKKLKKETGQSLVEFALVLPVLLIILGMVVDIARIIDIKIVLKSAACDSVRNIKTDAGKLSEAERAVAAYYDRLDLSSLNIDVIKNNSSRRTYNYHSRTADYMVFKTNQSYIDTFDVTVVLNYSVPVITPMGQLVLGKNFRVRESYTKMIVAERFKW